MVLTQQSAFNAATGVSHCLCGGRDLEELFPMPALCKDAERCFNIHRICHFSGLF